MERKRRNYKLNIDLVASCLLAVCVVCSLFGCASEASSSSIDKLEGQWNCDEMASDGTTYTDFYQLDIRENNEFSLYDAEAGNPGISGTITDCTISSDEGDNAHGTITVSFNDEDFDPPACWDIDDQATFDFETSGKNKMRLGYDDIYLSFIKE